MSATRPALALLLPSCIVMDVRPNSDGHSFSSVGPCTSGSWCAWNSA
ncbi:MAG TPA: hypothetical protein VFY71_02395 [Planctomycetota bacterium]|nr:hypothetical protein [Planctomycetota bacterium]